MKRWICVLLTTILILSSVTIGGFSASAEEADLAASGAKVALTGKVSYNLSYHNYDDYHATSSYSYLAQNSDGTLTRLERIYNALKDTYEILIETYSSDSGTLKSSKTISCALPIFGGFYAGKNYNFIVFGKDNPSKSDTAEVIRVVRYSKAWAKLSNTSIYGSDTLVPFEAGSLDMTETGGKLYLHTSHKMYNGHQANMNFVIRESDSKLLESNFKVMNIKDTGYISHSFNQFIETDGKDLYRVDHGDSLPRSITIVKTAVSKKLTDVTYKEVINLSKTGANGLNWTGAMIGGFALTDKNCIIAGTVVNYQNYDTNPDQTENIFVSVTGKDFKTNKVTKLTNYNKNSGVTVYNPHLTKISNAKLLVIWEEYHSSDQRYYTKMATVDGTGALSSAVYSSDCFVSDCEPILCKDGYVRWYAGTAESETLYAINPNSLSAASSSQAQSSDIAAKPIPVTLRVGEEYLLTNIDRAGKISWGYNRTGIVNFDKNTRRITGIATGSVRFYAAAKGRTVYYDVTVAPAVAKINSASVTNSGVSLSWTGVSDASAYKIYIKKSGSSWTGLAVVSGTSFIDHQTTAGASLTYTVRSVDAGGCLFDDYDRLGYTLKYLQTPKITGFENKGGGTVIKWGAVTGASKYALFVKSGSSWKTLATVPGASYTHKISSSGTTNTYTVRCVSSDGKTFESGYDAVGVKNQYVAVPKITKFENVVGGAKITWQKTAGAAKYRLYVRSGSSWKTLATVSSAAYTHKNLKSGTTYTYTVRCVSSDGKKFTSSYNASGFKNKYIAAPTLKSARNTSSGVRIDFSKVTGARKYRVFRKTAGSGWKAIANVDQSGNYYVDKSSKSGVTYYYTVRCISSDGKRFESGYNTTGIKIKCKR